MRLRASFLSAFLFLVASGCDWRNGATLLGTAILSLGGVGSDVRVSAGSTYSWQAPSSLGPQGRYSGIGYSCFEEGNFGVEALYFGGTTTEELATVCMNYEVELWRNNTVAERARWRCTVRPEVGWWIWSESPEESGPLFGLTLAPGLYLGEKYEWQHYLALEFKWHWLQDVDGDADARVLRMLLAYTVDF